MARNQFGVICDICGSMSKNSKEFYRLALPTYESNMSNAVSHKDFCFSCYKELKELLNKAYIKEHSKEATYNARSNICINCGDNATHYHHVVPKVLGGNNTTNIVPLCDKCHGLIHSVSYQNGVISHSELTKIGLRKAKEKGKRVGTPKGTKLTTKKSIEMKEKIKELNYNFNGSMSNEDTYKFLGISRNTFYKYKREIMEETKSNDGLDQIEEV